MYLLTPQVFQVELFQISLKCKNPCSFNKLPRDRRTAETLSSFNNYIISNNDVFILRVFCESHELNQVSNYVILRFQHPIILENQNSWRWRKETNIWDSWRYLKTIQFWNCVEIIVLKLIYIYIFVALLTEKAWKRWGVEKHPGPELWFLSVIFH